MLPVSGIYHFIFIIIELVTLVIVVANCCCDTSFIRSVCFLIHPVHSWMDPVVELRFVFADRWSHLTCLYKKSFLLLWLRWWWLIAESEVRSLLFSSEQRFEKQLNGQNNVTSLNYLFLQSHPTSQSSRSAHWENSHLHQDQSKAGIVCYLERGGLISGRTMTTQRSLLWPLLFQNTLLQSFEFKVGYSIAA